MTTTADLSAYLERFGLQSFRPGQREVIEAIADGHHCLCIMPTGGGKSLCYQLPAVMRDGVTLVVSPLIALMKDQVDSMHALGIRATFLNSSLTFGEQRERSEALAAGEYDLVYVAPERFRSRAFFELVRNANVNLLAIDEAHCVSEWGHDFRPSYARLGQIRERLGNPQTIALTATATPTVRDDVVKTLGLEDPKAFVTGFGRPNLSFSVATPSGERAKEEALLEILTETPGSGIIYAATRKKCEELMELLSSEYAGTVGVYHAGLLPDDRRRVQEEFMSGDLSVIVATNAFGMGIDKSDLRFVVHYNMPGSLEAYYQEAGRAGRDGLDSKCMLLFSLSDRYVQQFFIENSYPSRDVVKLVYDYLRRQPEDPIEITQQDLKEHLKLTLGSEGIGACERLLEKSGVLERLDSNQNQAAVRISGNLPTLIDMVPREAKKRRKVLRAIERHVGDVRDEWVYFHPNDIARDADVGRDTVNRSIKDLTALKAFDYVPPFRGLAIRMLKRDATFESLEIDFTELETRCAAEFQKLERVIRYAQTGRCRQIEILDYFGDPDSQACGVCDNCTRHGGPSIAAAEGEVDAGVLRTVRIVLSGIARGGGRFGRDVIAQMLFGSKSAKMTKFRLDQLSTYGLLSHLRLAEVVSLLEGLAAASLIEQVEIDRFRPVLRLTPDGEAIMKGEAELQRSPPVPPELLAKISTGEVEQQEGTPTASIDIALSQALRAWRQNTADRLGHPAYRVLTNATLDLISRQRPTTLTLLSDIKGVGQSTLDNFGEAILALVNERLAEQTIQLQENLRTTPQPQSETNGATTTIEIEEVEVEDEVEYEPEEVDSYDSDDDAEVEDNVTDDADVDSTPISTSPTHGIEAPTHFWTWRLLSSGFTFYECCQVRRIEEDEVYRHMILAGESGLKMKPSWLLSPAQITDLCAPDAKQRAESDDRFRLQMRYFELCG